LDYPAINFGAFTMSSTQDILINMPTQTAEQLEALVQARGVGSAGDIITEALAALSSEAEENGRIAAMVAAGFESETWHEVSDVRAAIKQRYIPQ
jgi:Arc/MetJ-type ribon-helix-helix transcriptional regulator